MKIVFMGTPQFAVPCLERLLDDDRVLAVFTQPDKPQGRKMLLTPPPVKVCAQAHGIPVWQPEKLKNNSEVLEYLRILAPDVIVVVAYGKILPQELLDIPKFGCINVHASLLPKYRGSAPIQWAVLGGEAETGVTTMQMDAGVDTGDMLLQAKTPIPQDMTAGELHDVLSELGAETLSRTLCLLEQGSLSPQKQDDALSCHAPMLSKALSPIDWTKSAWDIHNQIRGLNPWPGSFMAFESRHVKVHRARLAEGAAQPGEHLIDEARSWRVGCGDGRCIELLEVQAEGKRAMGAAEFLMGHRR